jgi:hypothetical protein
VTDDVSDLHVTCPDPATVAPSSLVNSSHDLHTSREMVAMLPGLRASAERTCVVPELPKHQTMKA